jgi:hypothetical protein
VPTDGSTIKGKTWGPSTLHQRERGFLPAALRTTVCRTPQFSKSAPNLDKTRTAVTTSSSRNEILGKSHEALNTVTNSISSSSSHNNNNHNNNNINSKSRHHRKTKPDDDGTLSNGAVLSVNDDEMAEISCWGFIRSDNNSSYKSNNKKYSLDSKLPTKKTVTPGSNEESTNLLNTKSLDNSKAELNHGVADDVNYDRVFYRDIQKSLDQIFARNDFPEESTIPRRSGGRVERVSSKSSDDLSMYGTTTATSSATITNSENPYRFQRYGSESKFKRECFFTKESHSLDSSTDHNGEESSPSRNNKNNNNNSNNSVSDNFLNSSSSSSSKIVVDSNKNNSFVDLDVQNFAKARPIVENWNRSFDERSNSFCSDTSSSVGGNISSSRKSSVTFRTPQVESTADIDDFDEDPTSQQHNPTASLLRTSTATSADISVFRSGLKSSLKYYDLPTNNHMPLQKKPSFTKTLLRNKIDKTKQKTKGMSFARHFKMFRLRKDLTTNHNSSSYNKSPNDMNEQLLLVDESPTSLIHSSPLSVDATTLNGSTNSATIQEIENESPYDSILYTKNFVLARNNNGN